MKIEIMKTRFFLLFGFILIVKSISSQDFKPQEFEIATAGTENGLKIIYSSLDKSFTIDVHGEQINFTESPYFYIVDGKIFQAMILGFQKELDFDNLKENEQKEYLTQYMNYEIEYFKDELKIKIKNLANEFYIVNDKLFLFWYYNMPPKNKTAEKQLYLTTICHDQILNLNTIQEPESEFIHSKDFLFNVAKTLKIENKSADYEKIQKESLGDTLNIELLKLGDNLFEFISKNPPAFKKDQIKMSEWIEGEVELFSYSESRPTDYPIVFYSSITKKPFGVLQNDKKNEAIYLFDTDGDSIIDFKSGKFILPFWLIKINSNNCSSVNNIKEFLDTQYSIFQSDLGPKDTEKLLTVIKKYGSFYEDNSIENRDILSALFLFSYNSNEPVIAINLINEAKNIYEKRFNSSHPVFLLFEGETLIKLEDFDRARIVFSKLLEENPDFIPALFYDCILSKNDQLLNEKTNYLKKNYRNHWLIKRL